MASAIFPRSVKWRPEESFLHRKGVSPELSGELTAKFIAQLAGFAILLARLGQIPTLLILEGKAQISNRIVGILLDCLLISLDRARGVAGFRIRDAQIV